MDAPCIVAHYQPAMRKLVKEHAEVGLPRTINNTRIVWKALLNGLRNENILFAAEKHKPRIDLRQKLLNQRNPMLDGPALGTMVRASADETNVIALRNASLDGCSIADAGVPHPACEVEMVLHLMRVLRIGQCHQNIIAEKRALLFRKPQRERMSSPKNQSPNVAPERIIHA